MFKQDLTVRLSAEAYAFAFAVQTVGELEFLPGTFVLGHFADMEQTT
jgi:hypothetical protein